MSLKENFDIIQTTVDHNEVSKACSLGIFKNDTKIPDNKKCLEIIKKNFSNNDPNIYIKDKKGVETSWTPLMMCSYMEHYDGINFLLEKGANPNMVGKDGKSALAMASIKNKSSIIKLLLNSKADINYMDTQGRTALMNACEAGIFENVKTLLENKADIKIKNKYNQTCTDVGLENKHFDLIKFIEHFYLDSILKTKDKSDRSRTKI